MSCSTPSAERVEVVPESPVPVNVRTGTMGARSWRWRPRKWKTGCANLAVSSGYPPPAMFNTWGRNAQGPKNGGANNLVMHKEKLDTLGQSGI